MHHDDGPYLPARLALLPAARYFVTNLTWRPGNFAQCPDNRGGTFRPGRMADHPEVIHMRG
jgi:hypothetical protein